MQPDKFEELLSTLEQMVQAAAEPLELFNGLGHTAGGITPPIAGAESALPTSRDQGSVGVVESLLRTAASESAGQQDGADPNAASGSPGGVGDLGQLTAALEKLQPVTSSAPASPEANTTSALGSVVQSLTGASSSEGAFGKIASSLFGSAFGLSPIISGLMGLFGGGGQDPPPPLVHFALPGRIREDAGLQGDNSFTSASYAETGIAKAPAQGGGVSSAPSINVNIQAMDSQSFLDRSDDIARAVKDAMLRSHPLNDLVADL